MSKEHLHPESYGLGEFNTMDVKVESWCYEEMGSLAVVLHITELAEPKRYLGNLIINLPIRKLRGYVARRDKPDKRSAKPKRGRGSK